MNKALIVALALAFVVALAALSMAISARPSPVVEPGAKLMVGSVATSSTPEELDTAPEAVTENIQENKEIITTPQTPSPTPPQKVTMTIGPTDIYLQSRACFNTIENFDGMVMCSKLYGTQKIQDQILEKQTETEAMPKEFLDGLALLAKEPRADAIQIVNETIIGDTATLEVVTLDKSKQATVTMKLEKGAWKVDLESWSAVM